MVLFDLNVKVASENAQALKVDQNYQWNFKVQCGKCFQEHTNEVNFTSNDKIESDKGHSIVNFLMKCKECKQVITIDVHKSSVFNVSLESGNDEGTLATFECRGVTLVGFNPIEPFTIEAADSGFEFSADISDLVCEYDEKTGNMVNILEPAEWSLVSKK